MCAEIVMLNFELNTNIYLIVSYVFSSKILQLTKIN
jgi:hypothetical protein